MKTILDKLIKTVKNITINNNNSEEKNNYFHNYPKENLNILTLEEMKRILVTADRSGAERDNPEGSRVITISDTLAWQMVDSLDLFICEYEELKRIGKNHYQEVRAEAYQQLLKLKMDKIQKEKIKKLTNQKNKKVKEI